MEEIFSQEALKGKVSVVTGGGRGLGRVMALALAKAGSDVVLAARSRDQIDRVAEEVSAIGRRAFAIKADVTNSEDITGMVESVVSEFGKIDVLVNNAGQVAGLVRHKFEDIPEDEWVQMIHTNVTGVFLVSRIVGKSMLERGAGRIINIASTFGVKAIPTFACYCVSKAAVIHMTKAMAVEWAERGIRVNAIAPGSFEISGGSGVKKIAGENDERAKRVPMGRIGRAEELGPLVVYLASDVSDYMTGETIFLDGGLAAK